jgi:hypothetical protein
MPLLDLVEDHLKIIVVKVFSVDTKHAKRGQYCFVQHIRVTIPQLLLQ